MHTPSWLITHKLSGIVVDETFTAAEADQINADPDSPFLAVPYKPAEPTAPTTKEQDRC